MMFALGIAWMVAAAAPAPAPAPGVADAVDKTVEAVEMLQRALGFKLKPTGFVAGHVVFNTGSAQPSGDAPFFVAQNSKTIYQVGTALPWESDGSLVITGRQSRFGAEAGFNISRWLDAKAVLEFDLWALYRADIPPSITAGTVRLRLAYAEFGNTYFSILAGQALSVVSPGYPLSVGHLAVAAFTQAGFLWQRLPQLTLNLNLPLWFAPPVLGAPKLFAAVSLARPLSGDHATHDVIVFDTRDPGTASMLPLLQARAGLDGKHLTLAVSAQAGVESWPLQTVTGTPDGGKLVETWLLAADARAALAGFTLQGQVFVGTNLNGMFGMMGVRRTEVDVRDRQGAVTGKALLDVHSWPSAGGWLQVAGPVWPKVANWHLGIGTEQALTEWGLPASTGVGNAALQAGLLFPVHAHLDAGVESYQVVSRFAQSTRLAWNDSFAFMLRVKL